MTNMSASLLPGVPWVESPFFEEELPGAQLDPEVYRIAVDLHRDGFAVLEFPDAEIDDRAKRIKAALSGAYNWDSWRNAGYLRGEGMRIQDAWCYNADVREIAINNRIIAILRSLYGRRPIPFQTLNFPVGTQQHFHSDSLHFSCVPERFMCGVWLALEDVDKDNGPLVYFPGSHRWPIYSNEHIGHLITETGSFSQKNFEPLWQALVRAHGVVLKRFLAKKGQALIWAANLLHGGDRQNSSERTRWSQVTHYYFEDCVYYTPMASLPSLGVFASRTVTDIVSGELVDNTLMGRKVEQRDIERPAFRPKHEVADFQPVAYLAANPDVAASGMDPLVHYQQYGQREGRRLRP